MIIPGFNNYDITEDGVVTHVPTGRVLKHTVEKVGGMYEYSNVILVAGNGMRRKHNVIRLLALTYLEKPDVPCVARAKDNNNLNTVLSNVEWVRCSDSVKYYWKSGRMNNRKPRASSVTEGFIALLYDTMCLYDRPTTMSELSYELEVPYPTIRYSMYTLIQRGKAVKGKKGFEAIK